MSSQIYRGYDITCSDDGKWCVYSPGKDKVIHNCNSEKEAHDFVDKHKRERAAREAQRKEKQ
ncbi:MAG TPA: hypothetical protein VKB76_11300 [Ktedonobacterales bacterium]|nr:hypothetical protein [Ktedonobacterales bacterium]